jgi:hypothetical protein
MFFQSALRRLSAWKTGPLACERKEIKGEGKVVQLFCYAAWKPGADSPANSKGYLAESI